ncbi:MAG: Zn-dependent alcohol dehydrogenase [Acidimicrobiales bacterium]|nr:MAG: Zn-dependent alcohol dehydrogenase [Acidimicrobiales bacterium]
MRGIVYDGTETNLVTGLELRAPGPREVIVEIKAAGLCHSDLSYMSGLYPVPSPGVCGHEGAGIVAEVGSAVSLVAPGDHVIIATLQACGTCEYCADGRPTACRSTLANWSQPFTLDGQPLFNFAATSAFAERTLVRDVQCVKIPDDVPLTSAAIVGCGVVTGMGAVFNRANVRRGQSAVVFGVGGVGLNVIQALEVQGATTIIAVDTVVDKEVLARTFGATHFLDGNRDDLVAAVGEIRPASESDARGPYNSGGVNWAFDCVAHPQVTYNALECLDWEGTVVVIGVASQTAEFHGLYGRLTQVDRGIIGCRYGSISPHRDIPRIIEMYRRGDILLDELVTAAHPIERWTDAVHELESGAVARGVLTF